MLQIGINIIVSAQPTGGPSPVHEQFMISEGEPYNTTFKIITESGDDIITE